MVAAFGLAACTGGDDPVPAPPLRSIPTTIVSDDPALQPSAADSTSAAADATSLEFDLEWNEVVDGVDEGFLTVPLDYSDPQGDTIDLYLARLDHLLCDRSGWRQLSPGHLSVQPCPSCGH